MYKYASAEFFRKEHTLPQGDCSPRGRGRGEQPFSYGGVGGCGFGTQPCLGHRRAWWGGRREMGCRGTRDRVEEMGVVLQM